MASVEIIEEISQFYDIKQKVSENDAIYYYIVYRDINMNIGIKYPDGLYYSYSFNANTKNLREYIDKIMLLIDKLNDMFIFTYHNDIIQVGSVKIEFLYGNYINVGNYPFYKNYDNVCDVIECLKGSCPECIKPGDIKIALKDGHHN